VNATQPTGSFDSLATSARPGSLLDVTTTRTTKPGVRAAFTQVMVGGAQVVAALATAPVRRSRWNRWGATPAEVVAALPGDELVPEPTLGYTRAISIAAPVEAVWPWLAQIGQGRGGLYSFDGLENLFRCGIHSADVVLPDHQELNAGDLIRLGPEGYPCFRVVQVDPPTTLVLLGADPKPPHEVGHDVSAGPVATWQWLLRPTDDGRSTRLVVRQRLAHPKAQRVMWHLVEPVGFVMEREMLRGLKRRAEATQQPAG